MNTLKFGNGEWYGKKDTILAYNDENSNFKPLPFSFDRASSATRVNKDGLIETVGSGEPRIDYKDDSKGALLLEPTKTNILPYSEDFNDAAWVKLGTTFTITSNNVISPSGKLNASTINVTNNDNILYDSISLSSNASAWVFTLYAKGSGTFDMNIRINSAITTTETKTLTSEWQRFEVLVQVGVSTTSVENFIELNTSSTYEIWGAQVEESYATSYIPTQGSIGTRVADSCLQVIPSDISLSTSGTVFLDYTLNIKLTTSHFPFSIIDYNNGSLGEWISRGSFRFSILTNGNLEYAFQLLNGTLSSPTQVSNVFPNIGSRGKMAISWNGTNVTFSVNGVNYQDTLSANFTGSLDGIYLGQLGTFNNTHKEGKFNEVKLYNTRLSNAELQALTS